MDLTQVFGFLIAFGALIYSVVAEKRSAKKTIAGALNASHEGQGQKDKLKAFLKSLELDMQDEVESKKQVQPRSSRHKVKLSHAQKKDSRGKARPRVEEPYPVNEDVLSTRRQDQAEELHVKSQGEYHDPYGKVGGPVNLANATDVKDYQVIGKAKASRIHKLLNGVPSKKQLLALQEIIGKPKGM